MLDIAIFYSNHLQDDECCILYLAIHKTVSPFYLQIHFTIHPCCTENDNGFAFTVLYRK